ncbi:hypothetical protein XENOCAPTIV_023569 [Xenoophorus captivus]|uniref:Uncharacterized protein n=1 Tax=Xenoophorus captivus TaxID=1517983 RepID=A0ABV0QJS4_9TELE
MMEPKYLRLGIYQREKKPIRKRLTGSAFLFAGGFLLQAWCVLHQRCCQRVWWLLVWQRITEKSLSSSLLRQNLPHKAQNCNFFRQTTASPVQTATSLLSASPAPHPHTHTLIHTPNGNLERPVNQTGVSLECGMKPEYPERTHACTERTCKLHAERPLARSQTQDLLAARQQSYNLLHRAALSLCFIFYLFLLFHADYFNVTMSHSNVNSSTAT